MTVSFFERLELRCRAIDSLLCVGLDPHPSDLPERSAAAARDFCYRLIDATAPVAAAYKPNSAFFEVYGADGMQALKDVIAHAGGEIPVLLDAKRGDIGSTSEAYAEAAFRTLGADALTVSPYLGKDAIEPFMSDPAHGIFLLCKTSNPGASDLQDLVANGQTVYAHVAQLADQWNKRGNVGIVVGATYPEVLAELRTLVPDLWFLVPGTGTQGGDLHAALQAGLRGDGLGVLLPVSRGISRAKNPGQAAQELRDEINKARVTKTKVRKPIFTNQQLADDLLRLCCVQFGEFTLKSGKSSPIYLDLRRLVGDPAALARAAAAYIKLMGKLKFDRVAGLPYAALPIATAISLQAGWPLIYPRKEAKDYGTKSVIEGPYDAGETAVVIDDLITTGGSKLEGIEKLEAVGLRVRDVVVLIDRRSKTESPFGEKGIKLHSIFQLTDLLSHWQQSGAITPLQSQQVSDFLQSG
jgi:uridine monophosphate synthetase